jgi:Asp-tRNA(Asn)/Glu-tRNA(Gln) amidotransferase A subunit family amidase
LCLQNRYARYIGTKRDYNEGKEVETSWCVRKIEEQGAILVGKLNMHELGMGKFRRHPSMSLVSDQLED